MNSIKNLRMENQNLFNALQDVCGFTALQTDMIEIIDAYEKDKSGQLVNIPDSKMKTIDKLNEILKDLKQGKTSTDNAEGQILRFLLSPEETEEDDSLNVFKIENYPK